MDSYQSLLGLSDLSADLFQVDTLLVNKDLTVFGGSTLMTPIFPTGAALHKVLTCNDLLGTAVWQDPADAVLAGDCVGFGSSNRVDTLANGTIPVNTLVTLAGTQTLTNKTLTNVAKVAYTNADVRKRLTLWDNGVATDSNDHRFSGLGKISQAMLLSLTTTTDDFVFSAATSATTSNELVRIKGNGSVIIPGPLKLTSGGAAGSVLTSDATGNATWLAPAVTTSVGDLTMSGKLLDPLGKYLLARSGNTVFMGGAGMNIFNQSNLAIGYNACSTINAFGFCATGHVAIGNNSLLNSAGNYNCAVGFQSCMANTSGSSNCGFGTNVLLANTVGNGNTAVGHFAGQSITAGYNTCVGERSDVSAGITNSMALGYQAVASTSNTIQLGNSSVVSVNTSGTINTPALNAGTLNAGASTLSTLGVGNLNAGPTTLESLAVGAGTTLATLSAGATTVTTLNAGTTVVGGLTANATTLASLNVNGNSLLQQLGVMSTISCQYGISCGSLTFHSGTALSYFEEYSMAIKWSGPFATLINDTIKIVRIGSKVTVQFNGFSNTVTLVSNIIQTDASTLLPARFVRSSISTGICTGENAGIASIFSLSVNTSGYMFITRIPNSNFSSGTCSLNPCTFTWVL